MIPSAIPTMAPVGMPLPFPDEDALSSEPPGTWDASPGAEVMLPDETEVASVVGSGPPNAVVAPSAAESSDSAVAGTGIDAAAATPVEDRLAAGFGVSTALLGCDSATAAGVGLDAAGAAGAGVFAAGAATATGLAAGEAAGEAGGVAAAAGEAAAAAAVAGAASSGSRNGGSTGGTGWGNGGKNGRAAGNGGPSGRGLIGVSSTIAVGLTSGESGVRKMGPSRAASSLTRSNGL